VIRYIAALIALLLFCPATAHASCSIPPGEAGDIGFNSDSRVLQWCDGTDWYAAGQINPAGPNAGCLNPAGLAGDVIYNDAHNLLQYCDGDHWQGIGGGVDMVPAGFTFTDLLNQAQSSLVTSNIVSITDLGVAADVSISGDGSPQFRINGGSWVTSGTINDGDTLQLRLTTNAAMSTANTATVVVGTIGAIWSASTVGADTVPNAFSFSDQTGVATSFLTSSNTITITGINSSTPVSVSGGGSPQISINGGAWGTSGNIDNGQSLQVRLTSSASYDTTLSATVDVGGVTDQWDVATIDDKMVLLVHADGSDGSTSIPDSSIHSQTVTVSGNAQIDTAQSKFGGSSLYFDGTNDFVYLNGGSDYNFGTGDFTIDFWVRQQATIYSVLFDARPSGSPSLTNRLIIGINASGILFTNSSAVGSTPLVANTWYHVAYVRSGGVGKLYLNGIQDGTVDNGDTKNYTVGTSRFAIGTDGNVTSATELQGWMDEIRIVKGSAEWTSNFTPPSAAY
jgi:hypothetical protein